MIKYLHFLCLILLPVMLEAQEEQKPSKVIIENADRQLTEIKDDAYVHYLKGNVRCIQDSIFMFCDSATLTENRLIAVNDIAILQGDSIKIFSDSLDYRGDLELAELFFDVVLENNDKKLFTDWLIYDLQNKIATFRDTCQLVNNTLQLNSLRAVYYVGKEMAYMYDEVTAIDENFKLKTDSLLYDASIDRVYFIAPTFIEQDGKRIYCESGFYDIQDKRAYFDQNPVYYSEDQFAKSQNMFYSGRDSLTILSGDAFVRDSTSEASAKVIKMNDKNGDVILDGDALYVEGEKRVEGRYIVYNKNTKDVRMEGRSRVSYEDGYVDGDSIVYLNGPDEGEIIGDPVWEDTLENRVLKGGRFFYKERVKYFKAVRDTERPLFRQLINEDTLFFSADTIISAEDADSIGYMMAIRDVKIYMKDLQALCDSLYYSEKDSMFRLFYNPVAWSDTTQFVGDTMMIQMKNDEVSDIFAFANAFICSQESESYFNQIKGKKVHAVLDSNQLQRMDVEGNAESLYFIKDEEEAYIGPLKTNSLKITFLFENDSLNFIKLTPENESVLTPMNKASEADFKLPGFKWEIKFRPLSWTDVLKSTKGRMVAPIPAKAENNVEKDFFETEVDKILDKPRTDQAPRVQKKKN